MVYEQQSIVSELSQLESSIVSEVEDSTLLVTRPKEELIREATSVIGQPDIVLVDYRTCWMPPGSCGGGVVDDEAEDDDGCDRDKEEGVIGQASSTDVESCIEVVWCV